MKAVAYSVKPFEKEFLAKANHKKHDITLISNNLSLETVLYAEGKEAVIVFTNDDVSAAVIERLAALGTKYIATRSTRTDHIDILAADHNKIKLANVPDYSPMAIAEYSAALAFALNRNIVNTGMLSRRFNFVNDETVGFNFYGKTVGIIGLGKIGLAVADIYKGMGCTVIGYDPAFPNEARHVRPVGLEQLLELADIISIHLPPGYTGKHFIDTKTLNKMKDGVMLINTSKGAIINTVDVIAALESGKVGYLGMDTYENESGLFFKDHQNGQEKDPLLASLMALPNVLVTPHQAYLTKEALTEIAHQTINSLDLWQTGKCAGNACVCLTNCSPKNVN